MADDETETDNDSVIVRIKCFTRGRRLKIFTANSIQEICFTKCTIKLTSLPIETSRGTFLIKVHHQDASQLVSILNGQEIAELKGLRLFLTILNDEIKNDDDSGTLLQRAIEKETLLNSHKGHLQRPMEANTSLLPGIPGLLVVHNFITEKEESDLINDLDNRPWISQLSRRVQHFGATFDYVNRRPVEEGDNVDASVPTSVKEGDSVDASVPTSFPIASVPTLLHVSNLISDRGFLGDMGDDRIRHIRLTAPIQGCEELDALFPKTLTSTHYQSCDQITINEYTPGLGISSHVDTHIGFEDGIISLSLGAEYVMEFSSIQSTELEKKEEEEEEDTDNISVTDDVDETSNVYNIVLPRRSLLVLRGEARYAWKHSIVSRRTDCINGVVIPRGRRVSATFRVIRRQNRPCACAWPHACVDQRPSELYSPRLSQETRQSSQNKKSKPRQVSQSKAHSCGNSVRNATNNSNKVPKEPRGIAVDPDSIALPLVGQLSTPDIESRHVHALYDVIASHFSDTRHSRWPRVETYLSFLPKGMLLLDIGCGNGKYLGARPLGDLWAVGIDRSPGLVDICAQRNHEAAIGDALCVPFRKGVGDAVLCIAVLHHISTRPRRVLLIRQLIRSARADGGHILIYAWAQEQGKDSKRAFASQDVLVPWCLSTKYTGTAGEEAEVVDNSKAISDAQIAEAGGISDPARNVVVFQRYCHVYIAGELQGLTKEACEAEGLSFYGEKSSSNLTTSGNQQADIHGDVDIKHSDGAKTHLTVSTRPSDQDSVGPIASPESIPDSIFGPMRVNVSSNISIESAALIDETLLEGLDPITKRVATHASSCDKSIKRYDTRIQKESSNESSLGGGGGGGGGVRLLDAWWERDNWCILLRREEGDC